MVRTIPPANRENHARQMSLLPAEGIARRAIVSVPSTGIPPIIGADIMT
jgi:hypothetical protein